MGWGGLSLIWLCCLNCFLAPKDLFKPFGFLVPKDFQINWISHILPYPMKFIPETGRAH
jgi:hypothetical protein